MMRDSSKFSGFRIIGMLWLGQSFSGFIGFVTEALLARSLAKDEYGSLMTAMKAVILLAPLAGFGVGTYWLRCFGQEGWRAFRWVRGSFVWAGLSTVLTLIGILIWALMTGPYALLGKLLFWTSGILVAQAFLELTYSIFQLQSLYFHMSFWMVAPYTGRLMIALLAAGSGASALFVAKGYFFISLLIISCCLPYLFRMAKRQLRLYGHGDKPENAPDERPPDALAVAHMALPFGLGGLVNSVYFPLSLIILTYMKGPAVSAAYGVGLTVLTAIYFLPSVIYQKFLLPHLYRWAENDKSRFLRTYRLGNGGMLLLGGIIGALLAVLGPQIVLLIFGDKYRDAGRLMVLLSLCIPVRFVASSVGATLLNRENMRRKAKYGIVAASINILINILLVPLYGLYGAAAALIACEASLLILYLIGARRHVFGKDAWRGWDIRFNPKSYDALNRF